MNLANQNRNRIAVIGGGITALAAAHRLVELDAGLDVVLLEAGGRLGGVLESVRRDGFLIERSADNFIIDPPWAVNLCRRIGIADQLIPTAVEQRGALVVHRGRLERVPEGFMLLAPGRLWPLLTTPILSPWGKLRLLGERLVPRRGDDADESLGQFARRRLGRETFERIVQPLVGGIYTADPERLSLRATLPRFLEMERRHGSLIRAARRQHGALAPGASDGVGGADAVSGARYGLFVTPRNGLSSLVEAIAARLPAGTVQLNSPVESLARQVDGSWHVRRAAAATDEASVAYAGVVVAVGAQGAAGLLESLDRGLAADLRRIPYASTAIVTLAYRRDQIAHSLDGFGFVVPAVERRRILAGSFASVKFPGRAPADAVLVRVFIGGACQGELANLPDGELRDIAVDELRSLLGARGAPIFCDIVRWPGSMPQYHLGHCELVEQIERAAARWPNLALAGNAYHGVGIPNCIRSGELAAEHVAAAVQAAESR